MSLIKEIDFGTPIRVADKTVTLSIDGMSVTVPEGTSVMAAAMSLGTKIPKTLRDRHGRTRSAPAGSASSRSRAARGTPASCTTPAVLPGLVVRIPRPRTWLKKLRKGVMELYISDHPLDCLTCGGQWGLRAAGHGRRGRPARRALRL